MWSNKNALPKARHDSFLRPHQSEIFLNAPSSLLFAKLEDYFKNLPHDPPLLFVITLPLIPLLLTSHLKHSLYTSFSGNLSVLSFPLKSWKWKNSSCKYQLFFEKKQALCPHLCSSASAHRILPRSPRQPYFPEPSPIVPLARVYHSRRRVCGRGCTMCPRAVRSTEWVRQTRNIITSTAGSQAAVTPRALFLSIPFRRGGGVSLTL